MDQPATIAYPPVSIHPPPPVDAMDSASDGRAPLQPKLMRRRFGRYENFEQFNDLSSGHASVGSKSVGKITIDCQFLFRQSQWGVLSDDEFPAGILYLNLSFGPPQGCRLKSATVTVTLDEEDPCLKQYKEGETRRLHKSNCPVQITDWYGPKQLAGQEKSTEKRLLKKLAPELSALGNGFGGLGVEFETAFRQSARWSFNGQLLTGKKGWAYKTLQWQMTENELETQSFRNNKVYTAFTFEHAGQPFLMKVDIEGRLEKWDQRIKSKLTFGGGADSKESRTVTLIDFVEHTRFQQRLDEVARGLPRAMEMKNFEEIPVVVPNSIPATTFQTVNAANAIENRNNTLAAAATATTSAASISPGPETTLPASLQPLRLADVSSDGPFTENSRYPQDLFAGQNRTVRQTRADLTAEAFALVLRGLSDPEQDFPTSFEDVTFSPMAETLVSNTGEMTTDPTEGPGLEGTETKALTAGQVVDHQAVLRILQVPAVVGFLQLLAALMELLGYIPDGDKAPALGLPQPSPRSAHGGYSSQKTSGQDQPAKPEDVWEDALEYVQSPD